MSFDVVGDAYRRWLNYPKALGIHVSDDQLLQLATEIRAKAPYRHNQRDWSQGDKDLRGLIAEREFSIRTGEPMVIVPRPEGDGGVDFWIGPYSVDVKGAAKPWYLFREAGSRLMASVLYLAGVSEEDMSAYLVGWEFDEEMIKLPTNQRHPNGPQNHERHESKLKTLPDLESVAGVEFPS